MEVIRIPGTHIPAGQPAAVVALGFFDGVHLGHAALLAHTVEGAKRRSVLSAVFTFTEGGGMKAETPRLTTEEERLSLFALAGIDRAYLFDFAAIRDLSPAAFVEDILIRGLSCVAAVCGFNFRFGAGGAGDADTLTRLFAAHALPVTVLPPYTVDGIPVSSSAIRAAIEAGDPERTVALLGRPFSISGEVVHGNALGRAIGYPTANVTPAPGIVLPARGVYAALCTVDGGAPIPAVVNLGVRPTVAGAEATLNCEAHLLCESGDLYGRHLTLSLMRRLRGEIKFDSIADLRAQIAQDIAKVKEYFQWVNGRN